MKIWIDVCNSPQATMAKLFFEHWQSRGHDVVVTARPHANTEQLLKMYGVPFTSVGRHYGAGKIAKALGLFARSYQLWLRLKNENINVAFAQSSFYLPLVSRMLGVRSVYTNDNEKALGNVLGKIFSSDCVFPECWPSEAKYRILARHSYYPGVKEGIYFSLAAIDRKPRKLFYRPEAWDAQYYEPLNSGLIADFIATLAGYSSTSVLCRDERQAVFFESLGIDDLDVRQDVLSQEEIVRDAIAVICSGGSMAREFAISGVPTVSVYEHGRLAVDSLLISRGVLMAGRLESFDPKIYLEQYQASSDSGWVMKAGKEGFDLINRLVLS